MSLIKFKLPTPWLGSREKSKQLKPKTARWKQAALFAFFFSIWFVLLCFRFQHSLTTKPNTNPTDNPNVRSPVIPSTVCTAGSYVYVYDLPPQFNSGLLKDCRHINIYTNMCPHVANCGLGQPVSGLGQPWYATNQFLTETIVHARLENHPCRTPDPARADLFYVPFYGGLHASSKVREPDLVRRDALAVELAEYLGGTPWWRRNGGVDHFLTLGRTAWDFMRTSSQVRDFGANVLLNLPRVKNMSVLIIERHPWKGLNQHGMPYPSYFHPSTLDEMLKWQDTVRRSDRPYLFSFIGGTRTGVGKAAIRDDLLRQCAASTQCRFMRCGGAGSKCHEPVELLKVMMSSRFCLQAPGDSFTRRSTFDSILAGCIPVFFSRHTAYTQYAWFLPSDRHSYSVFINTPEGSPLDVNIEEMLSKIPGGTVEKMRSKVIELIPRITYAHPNSTDFGFKDAVDVALEALGDQVESKISKG